MNCIFQKTNGLVVCVYRIFRLVVHYILVSKALNITLCDIPKYNKTYTKMIKGLTNKHYGKKSTS